VNKVLYAVISLIAVVCALSGAHTAYAVSDYDDLIQTTDTVMANGENIAFNLYGIMYEYTVEHPEDTGFADELQKWEDAIGTGSGWSAITCGDDGFGNPTAVQIIVTNPSTGWEFFKRYSSNTASMGVTWTNTSTLLVIDNLQEDEWIIGGGAVCVGAIANTSLVSYWGFGAPYNSNNQKFLYINDLITYPEDYEGEIPPESITPPDDSDAVPQFTITVNNFKMQFSDKNFFTFDNPAFLCSDDLVPVLHYEIWDNTGPVMLASGVQSASSYIEYTFPDLGADHEYSIVGYYECGDTPSFTNSSVVDFTVLKNGSLDTSAFDACLKEEFPFIDIPACLENVTVLINMMSFGAVNIPNLPLRETLQFTMYKHCSLNALSRRPYTCAVERT